jgi:hypothetical protein
MGVGKDADNYIDGSYSLSAILKLILKITSLVIPTASDLADSLNTRASFVNYVVVL